MVRDREAVGFVADADENLKRLAPRLERHGICPAREIEALFGRCHFGIRERTLRARFRESNDAQIFATDFSQDFHRDAELTFTAVDHDELRILVLDVLETTSEHFAHRLEVVRTLDGTNAVATVLIFIRRAFFEDDLRGNGLFALEVRNVEALDAIRERWKLQAFLNFHEAPLLGFRLMHVIAEMALGIRIRHLKKLVAVLVRGVSNADFVPASLFQNGFE